LMRLWYWPFKKLMMKSCGMGSSSSCTNKL
jgi:hypothetical protein